MNTPKVTVIIPVYNTSAFLREMLDSVVGQTLRDIEIIMINDGSTDNSLAILEEYAQKDDRIKVISQTNQGLSATRNIGLEHAHGEYVYFMDSDDALELETLKACYTQCNENQLDVLTFDASVFGENIHLFGQEYYKRSDLIPDRKIFTGVDFLIYTLKNRSFRSSVCLYMMKKELVDQVGLRFYPKIIHEDQLFTVQLFASCHRIMYVPFAFFKRRIRSNSIMTNPFGWKNILGYTTVFDQLLSQKWSPRQLEAIHLHVSSTLNALLRYVAKGLIWSDKIKFARICIIRYKGHYKPLYLLLFLMRR